MNLDQLPFNAFDVAVVVILGLGIYYGRRKGMSGELLSVAKWLAILFGCAAVYMPIGSYFATGSSMFSTLACYVMAYAGAALVIGFCLGMIVADPILSFVADTLTLPITVYVQHRREAAYDTSNESANPPNPASRED